ncbi:MAG: GNAT family N-acetyltransferase [Flavobacteriales bacterium]|mgnify:CR=1 FL=1
MYIQNIELSEVNELNPESVFNSFDWLNIYDEKLIEILGIFNNNDDLIGFYYYQNHKRAKIITHISPPFLSPSSGLFVKDESTNPSKKNSFEKKVHDLILSHLKNKKFDLLTLPFPSIFKDMQPYLWGRFEVSPKYTYQINLSRSEEELLGSMSPERRKNITKSIKDGLIVKESIGCSHSQELIERTFQEQGLWYDKQVLTHLFSIFSSSERVIAYSTYHENHLLATVLCIRDKERAYYILGGYNKENSFSGAGAFAMWHAIKKAKELGCKVFDFEGSMHPTIEKYFRGFGGEMVPYFCLEKTNWKGSLLLKLRGK